MNDNIKIKSKSNKYKYAIDWKGKNVSHLLRFDVAAAVAAAAAGDQPHGPVC